MVYVSHTKHTHTHNHTQRHKLTERMTTGEVTKRFIKCAPVLSNQRMERKVFFCATSKFRSARARCTRTHSLTQSLTHSLTPPPQLTITPGPGLFVCLFAITLHVIPLRLTITTTEPLHSVRYVHLSVPLSYRMPSAMRKPRYNIVKWMAARRFVAGWLNILTKLCLERDSPAARPVYCGTTQQTFN